MGCHESKPTKDSEVDQSQLHNNRRSNKGLDESKSNLVNSKGKTRKNSEMSSSQLASKKAIIKTEKPQEWK